MIQLQLAFLQIQPSFGQPNFGQPNLGQPNLGQPNLDHATGQGVELQKIEFQKLLQQTNIIQQENIKQKIETENLKTINQNQIQNQINVIVFNSVGHNEKQIQEDNQQQTQGQNQEQTPEETQEKTQEKPPEEIQEETQELLQQQNFGKKQPAEIKQIIQQQTLLYQNEKITKNEKQVKDGFHQNFDPKNIADEKQKHLQSERFTPEKETITSKQQGQLDKSSFEKTDAHGNRQRQTEKTQEIIFLQKTPIPQNERKNNINEIERKIINVDFVTPQKEKNQNQKLSPNQQKTIDKQTQTKDYEKLNKQNKSTIQNDQYQQKSINLPTQKIKVNDKQNQQYINENDKINKKQEIEQVKNHYKITTDNQEQIPQQQNNIKQVKISFNQFENKDQKIQNFGEITYKINQSIKNGNHNFSVKLEPQNLGKIDINIAFDKQGQTQINFKFDNINAMEWMRANAHIIEKALESVGITQDKTVLQFQTSEQQNNNEKHFNNQQQNDLYQEEYQKQQQNAQKKQQTYNHEKNENLNPTNQIDDFNKLNKIDIRV